MAKTDYDRERAERTTEALRQALEWLTKDLGRYRTKPTKKDLARLAKCSVGILEKRARADAKRRRLVKRGVDGEPVKGDGGAPIPEPFGWPLDELKALQRRWKAEVQAEGTKPPAPRTPPRDAEEEIERLQERLRRFMKENAALHAAREVDRQRIQTHEAALSNKDREMGRLQEDVRRLTEDNVNLRAHRLTLVPGPSDE